MKLTALIALAASLVACAPQAGPTKRKMVGLLEKFDRWDYNGDGYLVASELDDAELIGGIGKTEILGFYDTSGDSRISMAEATAGMSRVGEAREIVSENQDGHE